MIERRDTASKTATDIELLGEERERERRSEKIALNALSRDLASGQVIFRGRTEDIDAADLRAMTQRLAAGRIGEIYPELSEFNASIRRDDVLHCSAPQIWALSPSRCARMGSASSGLPDGI